jgi:hypothetical protein
LSQFDQFYRGVHAPEVVAAQDGFVGYRQFSKLGEQRASAAVPDRLTWYLTGGAEAMQTYLHPPPGAPRPSYSPKPAAWRLSHPLWRGFWRTEWALGPMGSQPYVRLLAGSSAPLPSVDEARPWLVDEECDSAVALINVHDMSRSMWGAPAWCVLLGRGLAEPLRTAPERAFGWDAEFACTSSSSLTAPNIRS